MHKMRSVLAGCSLLLATSLEAQSDLFVITSDFASGSTAFLAANSTAAASNLLNIHPDAAGRYQDGKIYVINRLGQDNIIVLDPDEPSVPLTQFSVGNGANPHDIEIVADKAYITAYESAELLIFNPQSGEQSGAIDLSAFADEDGLPEVSQIVRRGDRLYLSCQRLDRNNGWGPAGISYVIVVDLTSDSLVDTDATTDGIQAIALSAANPNSLAVIGSKIAVGVVANFGDTAGGVELIDTATNQSEGLAVSEADLGGDITFMVMVDQMQGYAVVSDANFVNSVRPFNLQSGAVGAPLAGLSGGFISSIAVDGQRLIVGDRGSFDDPNAAGLKIYHAASGELLAGPISTGLPPSYIVVLSNEAVATAVADDEALPQQFALAKPYPNPFNASVLIPFGLEQSQHQAELQVYDVLGRSIRTLVAGTLAAGQHNWRWDGRDDSGETVGNGIYLVQLRAGGAQAAAKVILLK